ncbi:glutathione S-transferase-like protein [Pisolithus thermaeus]|nr:glutathione S-transferase-like protein [Pisolithus thermaeus]
MVVKIYGHAIAPTVRLVAGGEHKTPAFKQFQPFGQVPYIDDDGFILYESRAICRYLAKKYEEQGTLNLVPKDTKGEALFEQAVSIEASNFHPFVSGLASRRLLRSCCLNTEERHQGMETDETKVTVLLDNLNAKLSAYEVILGRQPYLAGEYITLADLFHLPYGTVAIEELGYDVLQDKPNVARWWKEISSRPAWQAVKNGA